MITAQSTQLEQPRESFEAPDRQRLATRSRSPTVFADVFEENVNLAIWERPLPASLEEAAKAVVTSNPTLKSAMTVSADDALAGARTALRASDNCGLSADIAELVEMFCYLLGVDRAGLRLVALSSPMCPKFHVDRVPCRLVTTYCGAGTEWVEHDRVDRSKFAANGGGKSGLRSGLLKSPDDVRQLGCGHVALLKGELWEGNENAGVVHRSPAVRPGETRLLVTLDVSQ